VGVDLDGLIDGPTAERWKRAEAGQDLRRRLDVASLEPGLVGVLYVTVRSLSGVRSYQRKRGGQGTLGRVTLADATGEVDLVLWDDELRMTKDGPFRAGARVVVQGATVKAGFRGGVELSLGAAVVTVVEEADDALAGSVLGVADARVLPDGRRNAQLRLATRLGEASITVWQDVMTQAEALPAGAKVRLSPAVPHPSLPGHWLSTPTTRLDRRLE
jgi:hypothetical protein